MTTLNLNLRSANGKFFIDWVKAIKSTLLKISSTENVFKIYGNQEVMLKNGMQLPAEEQHFGPKMLQFFVLLFILQYLFKTFLM